MQNIPSKDKDIKEEVCKTYLQKIRILMRRYAKYTFKR